MKNIFNKPLFFSWVLVILTLSLIIKSGLYSDDVQDFQMRKSMGNISFFQMIQVTHAAIVACSGRFVPMAYFEQSLIFWLSNSVLMFKIIVYLINLIAIFTFTRLLKIFKFEEWIPFALLIFCSDAQFYINYHDAFTSLHAMYPFMAILIFSPIILIKSFLENGQLWKLICAVFIVGIAVFYSEISLVIYPILILLLVYDKRSIYQKAKIFSPFIIIMIVYAVIFIWVRRNEQVLYSGITTDFTPSKMYNAFIFQVRAAVPMSHFTDMPAIPIFLYDQFAKMYHLVILCLLAFLGLFIYSPNSMYTKEPITHNIRFSLIGIILFIFPACMLMVSVKYQDELGYGMGYLPVYIQDFGFVILVLSLFSFIFSIVRNKIGQILKNALFVVFFTILICTLLQNNYLIDRMNYDRSTPSVYYYFSLKDGILKDCEDGSVIVLRTDYFYRAPYLYQIVIDNFYKKNFHVIAEENFNGLSSETHYYMLEHNNKAQSTVLYRITPTGKDIVKRINYPKGDSYSYFNLVSSSL